MRVRAVPRAPLPIAIAALLVAAGCLGPIQAGPTPVTGAGDVQTETRTAGEFTAISVDGGVNLVIAGGSPTAVTLSAQANLLPLVRSDVVDGQLVVTLPSPGVVSSRPVTVRVTVPRLVSISLGSGAKGTMEISTDVMAIDLSGGATMQAIGSVRHLSLTAASGASAQLGELAVDSSTVTMSGGAQATIRVATSVTGTADGGATVTLATKPGSQSIRTSNGAVVLGG